MNYKRIVRNKSVFCPLSKLRNMGIDLEFEHQDGGKLSEAKLNHIFLNVFEEHSNYQTLLNYYEDVLKGNENIYFSYAIFFDKNHALRIDKENNILLYFYQDRLKLGIPWEYPHLITCIGFANANLSLRSVLNDLKNVSALDFFFKYYFHRCNYGHSIACISEGYLIDGFLKIVINEHITFQWKDSDNNIREQYIADSWSEPNEDILRDMTNMNLIKFGKEYIGFWGR